MQHKDPELMKKINTYVSSFYWSGYKIFLSGEQDSLQSACENHDKRHKTVFEQNKIIS